MKIYFTGCHGSGKTTLARYVSETYKIPMISEVARMILSEKELQIDSLRSNINIVNDYQSSIFYRQIEEEKKHKTFVSDRSTIDSLAYCAQHTRIMHELIKTKEYTEYLDDLKDSLIFFIRPSKITLKNDGVRENTNWEGAIGIDAMIKMLHEMNNIKYIQIDTASMQERLNLVDNVINIFISSKGYIK